MVGFSEQKIGTTGPEYDKGLVVVVYGLDPIPGQLDPVIDYFCRSNDVFTYNYSNDVVATGDPYELPSFIERLTSRVAHVASDYPTERIRTAGASLGACIALNIQDKLDLTQSGVYATAGINVAKNLMYNPAFRISKIPQQMRKNKYSTSDVSRIWRDIDIHDDRPVNPNTRFWTNASMLDPIVWYPLVKHNVGRYNSHLQKSHALGHTATINEMAQHIAEATQQADSLPIY